jgi:hypothetical protein
MRQAVETPKPENPSSPERFERVLLVGTGLRGWHYGQRHVRPHQKAEHMAAPTNIAEQAKSSCQMGAVHTWRLTDIPEGTTMSALPAITDDDGRIRAILRRNQDEEHTT